MVGYAAKIFGIITFAGAAVVTLEFARRYFTKRYKRTLWKPVGRITELAVYPLKLGLKIELSKVYCTPYGLRSAVEERFRDG